MSFRTATAIARGIWLIYPTFVNNNLDIIVDMRNGNFKGLGITERQDEEAGAKLPLTAFAAAAATRYYNVSVYTDFTNVVEGSVAVVNLLGPVLKYGDMCSYGMVDKAQLLKRIAASGKFKSVILNIDSPGGQADGTQLLADTIKGVRAAGIPVYGVVDDGMMASAAMWIGAACTAVYATKATDMFGSIGVYTTIYDFTERLNLMGVKMIEIYADPSEDKNKGYYDALKGDEKIIKENINFLCETFIASVKENRGSRLQAGDENPFTGKMYPAQIAVDIGLIDGILPFDAVMEIADRAEDTTLSTNPNNSISMFGNKFKALSALAGVAAASITADQVAAVNDQVEAADIHGVTLVLDSELNTAEAAVTENTAGLAAINAILGEGNHKTTLTEAIAALTAASATAKTDLSTMTTDRDAWKKKAEAYGALPGEESTTGVKTEQETIPGTEVKNSFYSESDAALAVARAGMKKLPGKGK